MKFLYTFLFVILSSLISYAQETTVKIIPLQYNAALENVRLPLKTRSTDSIDLPFVDDFSYRGPYPDADLWADRQAFVNTSMAGDSTPSVGVATFDALDEKGRPYAKDPSLLGNIRGGMDTLTSNAINLRTILGVDGSPRPLSAADSIYMSFFMQIKGLGYAPVQSTDSLILQFKNDTSLWETVRVIRGIPDRFDADLDTVPPFVFYNIAIKDNRFLYGKFQFRFIAYGRRGGAYEHWHLDYVKIAPNRTLSSRSLDDLTFTTSPKPILRRYTSMPWRQASPQIGNELKTGYDAIFFNHFNAIRNPSNTNVRIGLSNGSEAVNNVTIIDGQNFSPNIFIKSSTKTYPTSLRQQLVNVPDTTEKLTVTTLFNLQFSPQEERDRKKAALRNDTVSGTTVFDSYFAYDDGTAEQAFASTAPTTYHALKFRLNVADSLRGVMFFFPHINGDAPKALSLNVRVWQDTLLSNAKAERLGLKPFYLTSIVDTIQGFTSYSLVDKDGKAIALNAGDFYVSWQSTTKDLLPIGLDRNNDQAKQYFYEFINNRWQPTAFRGKFGAIMVRPIFGRRPVRNSSTLKVNDLDTKNYFNIYPNPAREQLFIEPVKTGITNLNIEIIDLAGRLLKREILRGGNQIGLDGLSAGIYFLKIRDLDNNQIFNHKFVVER